MTGTCTPRVGYTRSTACAALTMLSEHNASQSYLLTVVTFLPALPLQSGVPRGLHLGHGRACDMSSAHTNMSLVTLAVPRRVGSGVTGKYNSCTKRRVP